jgi:hypothetical protein
MRRDSGARRACFSAPLPGRDQCQCWFRGLRAAKTAALTPGYDSRRREAAPRRSKLRRLKAAASCRTPSRRPWTPGVPPALKGPKAGRTAALLFQSRRSCTSPLPEATRCAAHSLMGSQRSPDPPRRVSPDCDPSASAYLAFSFCNVARAMPSMYGSFISRAIAKAWS